MASKTNKTGATDSTNMSLKLLIDTKQQRVVYAEAGKDFVDFLFNIPLFPLGAVMKLLSQQGMVGSLGNLQSSIENVSDTHMQEQKKENLLNPKLLNLGKNEQVLLPDVKASSFNTFYACTTCLNFAADNKDTWCPNNGCCSYMKRELKFVERPWKSSTPIGGEQGGYVKGATYMITDDLEVKPLSTFTSLILLKKFKVDVVGGLDERVVNLGKDEGMKLLNASLHSRTVLTDVFLVENGGFQTVSRLKKRKVGT